VHEREGVLDSFPTKGFVREKIEIHGMPVSQSQRDGGITI
jgi:hypothetical protein